MFTVLTVAVVMVVKLKFLVPLHQPLTLNVLGLRLLHHLAMRIFYYLLVR